MTWFGGFVVGVLSVVVVIALSLWVIDQVAKGED